MSADGKLGHEIKPEDLVVDVIGPDGNEVNFSELDVSYETLNFRTHQRKEFLQMKH